MFWFLSCFSIFYEILIFAHFRCANHDAIHGPNPDRLIRDYITNWGHDLGRTICLRSGGCYIFLFGWSLTSCFNKTFKSFEIKAVKRPQLFIPWSLNVLRSWLTIAHLITSHNNLCQGVGYDPDRLNCINPGRYSLDVRSTKCLWNEQYMYHMKHDKGSNIPRRCFDTAGVEKSILPTILPPIHASTDLWFKTGFPVRYQKHSSWPFFFFFANSKFPHLGLSISCTHSSRAPRVICAGSALQKGTWPKGGARAEI